MEPPAPESSKPPPLGQAGGAFRRAGPAALVAALCGGILAAGALALPAPPPSLLGPLLVAALAGTAFAVVLAVFAWRAASTARAQHMLLQQSIELLPCHFAAFDRFGRLVAWNDSYAGLHATAFRSVERPLTYAMLMRATIVATHPPDKVEAELAQRLEAHEKADGTPFERLYPNGRWMHVVKQRLPNGMVAGFALDITVAKQAEERVAFMARHDPLTGLLNRSGLIEALDQAVADPEGASLLLIDLDHFKQVNDRHGHAAGDAVLTEVARRLLATLRPRDLVFRLGGDEFAVRAHGVVDAAATQLAERVREALAEPCAFGSEALPMGASVGFAGAPAHAADAQALLRAADMALLEAKREGRLRARVYRPAMGEAARREARLREDIAGALERREFALVWQPQRDLLGGRLLGAEALLRWRNPRLGRLVPPDELLPVAGRAGLLAAIDAWVLEAALAQAGAWQRQGKGLPGVAVNMSAATLADPGLPDRLARLLAAHGVPAAVLEIELSAEHAERDMEAALSVLRVLEAMGVGLALDEVGQARAGLLQAARLPVRRIKLDPAIVAMLDTPWEADRRRGLAVLRASLALAEGLNQQVVATGVETSAQATVLRHEGVRAVQGHLTGRPVLAEDFPEPLPVATAGR
jgi:diguanylate cyclase (GGDEF)-like protein